MRLFLVFLLHINISALPPIPGYPLHAVPISRRKTVVAAQIEILHFVEHYGINHCGFLTLRSPSQTNLKKAQQDYNNASRRFLKELFPAWITMVEFDHYDRSHFHLVVNTRQDFRTGFNFDHYDRMRAISLRAYSEYRALTIVEKQERGVLARSLTANLALKAMWKQLRKKLPGFGFSKIRPAELVPIQKNAEAVAVYLTKQFLSSHLRSLIPRGARLFRTSADCPRVIPRISDLVIDTPGRRWYLECREHIREILGGLTHAQMAFSYGRRWAFRCGEVCMALSDQYGRAPIPWDCPAVLNLTDEIMVHGYVRPAVEDSLAHLR
jgi:hypothetical protein